MESLISRWLKDRKTSKTWERAELFYAIMDAVRERAWKRIQFPTVTALETSIQNAIGYYKTQAGKLISEREWEKIGDYLLIFMSKRIEEPTKTPKEYRKIASVEERLQRLVNTYDADGINYSKSRRRGTSAASHITKPTRSH